MSWVIDQARAVIARYNLNSGEVTSRKLLEICDAENILVRQFPLRGRVMERYIRTPDGISLLTIRSGVCREGYLKHYIAHGLGHHFLHGGNYAYLHGLWLDKQEAEAETFATVLLIPRVPAGCVYDVARVARVPLRVAERRLAYR